MASDFTPLPALSRLRSEGVIQLAFELAQLGGTDALCFFTLNLDAEADSTTPEGSSPASLPLRAEGLENISGKVLH